MYKALIIDDEKPVRIAVTKLGKWEKYHIETPSQASNGKEGLSTMRELQPEIVFVDMNMPVMDGGQFLATASKEFPKSQFIVISGYDEFSYAQQAIRHGACDYILKPLVEEELNQAIENAVLKLNPDDTPNTSATASEEDISPEQVVNIIKDYVDSNYCKNFKITMFEEKYYFSITYLTKLFRAKYGYTIYEYVLKLRMERAKELLEDPDIKILDIAERLGYSDNHYFSKAFRNYYGIAPTQYRRERRL